MIFKSNLAYVVVPVINGLTDVIEIIPGQGIFHEMSERRIKTVIDPFLFFGCEFHCYPFQGKLKKIIIPKDYKVRLPEAWIAPEFKNSNAPDQITAYS